MKGDAIYPVQFLCLFGQWEMITKAVSNRKFMPTNDHM